MPPSHDSLAILDDYFGIAAAKFSRLTPDLAISSFPDTLNGDDETERAQLADRLRPFSIISSMRERTKFPRALLEQLPNLKLILTTGLRNAAIPLDVCQELGIQVAGATGSVQGEGTTKTPAASSLDSTMEHGWALILALARNIVPDDNAIHAGGWQTEAAIGLKGKTMGLLGLGKLGGGTAKVAVHGFGMKVLAWSANLTQAKADEVAQSHGLASGTYKVAESKEELLKQSDIVSVYYVLSDRSRGLLGAKELSLMKRSAMLINISRGPIIDEAALLDTLTQGKIRGAALDVYEYEPLPQNSVWRTTSWGKDGRSKVLLSPHMGYVEAEVMDRWYEDQAENLAGFLVDGKLRNVMT